MIDEKHLVVIGGGWAGIAAAVEATERGFRVTVLEERRYLGGRAHSLTEQHTSNKIDNGQHLLMGCYEQTLSILKKLNTDHMLDWQHSLNVVFVDRHGKRSVLDTSVLRGKPGMVLGILRLGGMPLPSRLKIIRLALRVMLNRARSDNTTCLEFLQREKQTPESIEAFWKPLILATLNSPIEHADSMMLLAVMRLAFFAGGEHSKLILPKTTLSELVEPLTEWITHRGGEVRLGSRAESLLIDRGLITHVVLNDGEQIECDAVVTCIPTHALNRLHTPVPDLSYRYTEDTLTQASSHGILGTSALFPDFETSPIVNVYLWYEQHWMDEPFVAMLGTTTQWVFNKNTKQKKKGISTNNPGDANAGVTSDGNEQLVALTISAASEIVKDSAEQIVARCDSELRCAFPALDGIKLVHGFVLKEKTATPLFKPDERSKRNVDYSDLPRNLGVAGDWTDTGLPATIEGAARSGVAAIQRVLQSPSL